MTQINYLILFLLPFFVGCLGLQTRNDSVYKRESETVMNLRTENANLKAQLVSYQEQLRQYAGKVEELEIRLSRSEEGNVKRLGQENAELKAYKESVSALLDEKRKLINKITELEASNQTHAKQLKEAKRSAASHLKKGDGFFDDKKWAEAAAEYQSYREKSSSKKSEDYAMVTYKIGVCFQELGMKEEARTFYQSVIDKNGKAKAAKYAKYRISNLK